MSPVVKISVFCGSCEKMGKEISMESVIGPELKCLPQGWFVETNRPICPECLSKRKILQKEVT